LIHRTLVGGIPSIRATFSLYLLTAILVK